jgi:hypothetical protein
MQPFCYADAYFVFVSSSIRMNQSYAFIKKKKKVRKIRSTNIFTQIFCLACTLSLVRIFTYNIMSDDTMLLFIELLFSAQLIIILFILQLECLFILCVGEIAPQKEAGEESAMFISISLSVSLYHTKLVKKFKSKNDI